MRKSKYNSFDELPLMLTVEDVSHVLGIGLAHAYEVAHRRDFPTITLGSRIIVPRDKFMEWIDEQAAKNLKYFSSYSKTLWYVFVLKRRDHKWQRNEPTARAASVKAQRPLGGQIYPGHRPGHWPGYPEKRVRQDPGGVQRKAGESHSGESRRAAQSHGRLHRSGVVPTVV